MKLKEIYEKTKTGKYVQSLNEDVSKVIPKMTKVIKTLERMFLENGDDVDDAMILAVAKQVDEANVNYDDILDWSKRLITEKKKTRKS